MDQSPQAEENDQDIIGTGTIGGSYPVVWSLVVAMVAYALLHGVLRALLRVVSGSS